MAGSENITRKIADVLPLRILAADDQRSNLVFLGYVCRHLGHEFESVSTGSEVLARVSANPFDLVLLEVHMPTLSGPETARELIRRYPEKTSRPRIVAITASAESDLEVKTLCLAAGMDVYLTKPVMPAELQALVRQIFGRD